MADELVFYTHPMSRGRIVRWMLEETGARYRTEILTFDGSMKEAGYLAVNPLGKVPAIRHGETVVTEAAAVCAYLADAFPAAGLAPPPAERGDYYRWLFFAAGPLEMTVALKWLDVKVPDDRRRAIGCGDYPAVMDSLALAVSRHPYVAGDRFTAADVYVASHIAWGTHFGGIESRPAFLAYLERLATRPAAIRAAALDDAEAARLPEAG
ncbi:glutathione S-transferase family protein [Shinella daejeonensis]|uniref:glutathione S-transferase family protein n=1 Tax=Shinella daejeonensis TaxID=659017 RepID=UPI0020C81684|nr:glutathione S-transferase family protein [Shinella daejeonensis]MCP8893578.1 glutathione S-transferase family protein [Shinella daejeonensis]